MGRQVPPLIGTVGLRWLGLGLLIPFGSISGTSKYRGYIPRWPITFDVCCCTTPLTSRCGHVTGWVFTRGAPFVLGAGVRDIHTIYLLLPN